MSNFNVSHQTAMRALQRLESLDILQKIDERRRNQQCMAVDDRKTNPMRILDHLIRTIRSAANHNTEAQAAPACILWPDPNRQWQSAVPVLQAAMPELFTLGPYAPTTRTGPAIWLRGVLAGVLPPGAEPPEWDERNQVSSRSVSPPVFYLPGYSRQELREVNTCPAALKPLVELQFRGVIWSQVNARDWTILAFLQSARGGLGLDVATDAETKSAMQGALTWLLDENLAALQGRRLEAIDFNQLVVTDPVRDLLNWIDQEDAFHQQRSPEAWQAFVDITRTHYGIDPERASVLDGATALAEHKGAWQQVWARFCEAPQRYTVIPDRIRRCTMPATDLFATATTHEGWPQWNDSQEAALRADLLALANLPPHSVRRRIVELEQQHSDRRRLVWAALDAAPLARALKPLAELAAATELSLAAGSIDDLVDGYQRSGWRADHAFLTALAAVKYPEDLAAVNAAANTLYLAWAEGAAHYLQQLVETTGYPSSRLEGVQGAPGQPGVCHLFVDGLRFDLAQRLVERLTAAGCSVTSRPRWAALPSVTATAKPAVTPVAHQIRGADATSEFDPMIAATRQSLKGGYTLHKLLEEAGWQVLTGEAAGDPTRSAWCEAGSIDAEGHSRGWRLVYHLVTLLDEIAERIQRLQAAGWHTIHVVADHGWLLFPGGLPKGDLPATLTENKWGRCAAIKPGSYTPARLYPWFWNPAQSFALADGVSCYRAGMEYAHGGLSLQECLTLALTVTAAKAPVRRSVTLTDVGWKGMRCSIAVEGDTSGLTADIRTDAGRPESSLAVTPKPFKETGVVSLVVEEVDLAGMQAVIVVLDAEGALIAQTLTILGGSS